MSVTAPTPDATARPGWSRTAFVGGLAVIGCACAAGSIGEPGPIAGVASVLYLLMTAGALAGLYLLGCFGLGLGLTRLLARDSSAPMAMSFGLGVAAMLTLSHAMGVLGLLAHQATALVPVAVGVAIAARSAPSMLASARASARPSWLWLAGAPAVGVLIAAACNPPGWLWSSEFGGYDVLTYHLQLPREWHAAGRIWPLEHNVYSFLPSYIESAFVHLAAMLGSPRDGFVADDGFVLIASQLLHAGLALGCAWATGATAQVLLGSRGIATRAGRAIAGVLVIATPWAVVTGSMAYNEMGMLLLLLVAMLVSVDPKLQASRRGLLVGLLVGTACGCKPTALLLGAPAIGLVLLAATPRRSWPAAIGLCCVVGVAALSPWLIRNAAASGNPVFPQLASVFGSGHWTEEQLARYLKSHTHQGGLFGALKLLVVPDAGDPAAGPGRAVHRGLLHVQWAFTLPLAVVSIAAGLMFRSWRRWTLVLGAGLLLQILAWATLTHVQSRFLIPVLLTVPLLAAGVVSALLTAMRAAGGPCRGVMLSAGAILAATAVMTAGLFAGERHDLGGPNTLIAIGNTYFTNDWRLGDDPDEYPPDVYLRSQLPDGAMLLAVGDSSPLYKPDGTRYATTYDESPLARAIRQHPGDARAAIESLDSDYIYVDWLELGRLADSGYADPVLDVDTLQSMLLSNATLVHVFPLTNRSGEAVAARELYRVSGGPND